MNVKKLWVKVLVGTVLLSGAWGTTILNAEDEKTVPEKRVEAKEGTSGGILLRRSEKGNNLIVKLDDGSILHLSVGIGSLWDRVAKLVTLNRVRVSWHTVETMEGRDGRKLLSAIDSLVEGVKSGSTTGVITAKENSKALPGIELRCVKEKDKDKTSILERFTARWEGGDGKDAGPNKDTIKQISELHIGDKVKIDWSFDERKRIEKIEVLEAAAPKTEEARDGGDKDKDKEAKEREARIREAEAKVREAEAKIRGEGDKTELPKEEAKEEPKTPAKEEPNAPAKEEPKTPAKTDLGDDLDKVLE